MTPDNNTAFKVLIGDKEGKMFLNTFLTYMLKVIHSELGKLEKPVDAYAKTEVYNATEVDKLVNDSARTNKQVTDDITKQLQDYVTVTSVTKSLGQLAQLINSEIVNNKKTFSSLSDEQGRLAKQANKELVGLSKEITRIDKQLRKEYDSLIKELESHDKELATNVKELRVNLQEVVTELDDKIVTEVARLEELIKKRKAGSTTSINGILSLSQLTEILTAGYVPYTGATANVDLGANFLGIGTTPTSSLDILTTTANLTASTFATKVTQTTDNGFLTGQGFIQTYSGDIVSVPFDAYHGIQAKGQNIVISATGSVTGEYSGEDIIGANIDVSTNRNISVTPYAGFLYPSRSVKGLYLLASAGGSHTSLGASGYFTDLRCADFLAVSTQVFDGVGKTYTDNVTGFTAQASCNSSGTGTINKAITGARVSVTSSNMTSTTTIYGVKVSTGTDLGTATAWSLYADGGTVGSSFNLYNQGKGTFGSTANLGAKLNVTATTEQQRLYYDASNYFSTTVGSTGGVTFNAVGSGSAFTFSDSTIFNTAASTTNATFNKTHNSTSFLSNLAIATNSPTSGANLNLYSLNNTFTVANSAGVISNSNLYALSNAIVKTGAFNASTCVANRSSIGISTAAGSITNAILFQGAFTSENSANTITSAYGLKMEDYAGSASSAVTSIYGVYLGTLKGTGVVTSYGIYQAGANDVNFLNGQIRGNVGTAAAPQYSFNGFTNQGMYSVSTNVLGFSQGGAVRFQVFTAGVESSAQVRGLAVNAATPTFVSSGDTNTGVFFLNSDVMGIATGGLEAFRIDASQNTGFGTGATVSARIHGVSTTEQLRLGYDASNYWSATTSSVGGVTFNAVGSGAGFTFSDPVTVNGSLTLSAQNIITDTTTGMKIGTATTQKLGFYNATPIVQGASVADATGGVVIDAEARTAINALISRIEALGLIATV